MTEFIAAIVKYVGIANIKSAVKANINQTELFYFKRNKQRFWTLT